MIVYSFCLQDSCIISHSCNSIVKLYFVVQYVLSVTKLVDLLKSNRWLCNYIKSYALVVLRPEARIMKSNEFTEKYRKHNLDRI